MIALQSVVLPIPLRPMIATGSSPISNETSCERLRAAVEGVQALDRERAARQLIRLVDVTRVPR